MSEHCRQLADKLSAYLDGELQEKDAKEVMKHLEECECCRHCVETLKLTRDTVRKMSKPEMPKDMKDRLKSCLRKNCGY